MRRAIVTKRGSSLDVSLAAVAVALALVSACSSSSSSSGGTTDGGSTGTTDAGESVDAGEDAADAMVNECSTFVDRTGSSASRTIDWSFSITTASERCMTIKVGQSVTWQGDFNQHPLVPSGGDRPNPIGQLDPTTGQVTFTTAGTFGYKCDVHPPMIGAIKVVP